jgi:hypothetical protein
MKQEIGKKKQKIDTYVSEEEVARLRLICEKYGFRSIYQVLQCLVSCFLRVADPVEEASGKPLSAEIEEMFAANMEWETQEQARHSHTGMNLKHRRDQRKIKSPDDITG